MGWYDRHVLPRLIETACSQKPMMKLRAQYVPQASGRVLEIGVGTGLNLAYYGEGVQLTALDPAAELTGRAQARAEALELPVELLGVSGESIPAEDATFDTVVCTWTLCSIPDAAAALREMYRVTRPGGQLLFIEHGRSPEAGVHRWQQRLEPFWKAIAGGCHLTRAADELIQDAGYRLESLEAGYAPGPKVAAWLTHGVAVRS